MTGERGKVSTCSSVCQHLLFHNYQKLLFSFFLLSYSARRPRNVRDRWSRQQEQQQLHQQARLRGRRAVRTPSVCSSCLSCAYAGKVDVQLLVLVLVPEDPVTCRLGSGGVKFGPGRRVGNSQDKALLPVLCVLYDYGSFRFVHLFLPDSVQSIVLQASPSKRSLQRFSFTGAIGQRPILKD